MKIEVVPVIELHCMLSDGTKLASSSKEALIRTIENKIRGNCNVMSHYANEIERLNMEFKMLQKDLEAAKALE